MIGFILHKNGREKIPTLLLQQSLLLFLLFYLDLFQEIRLHMISSSLVSGLPSLGRLCLSPSSCGTFRLCSLWCNRRRTYYVDA